MSDVLAGNFATSRRGRFAEADIDFIRSKRRAGVPDSAIAQMVGRPVSDVTMVGKAVQPQPVRRPTYAHTEPGRGTLAHALWKASRLTGVGQADILGRSRVSHISKARQLAFWLAREMRDEAGGHKFSLPQIGRYFGVDHTSVLHGWRSIQAQRGPQ